MSSESAFIDLLREFAHHPAARGLMDDAAVLPFGTETLVLTHDTMAQGVHFLDSADPADVAWKLVAVNLSDLAAKGAEPVGVMLGYSLSEDDWDGAFAAGLKHALEQYDVPLLGGDTVALQNGAGSQPGRVFGMTAIGRATSANIPARSGALAGDGLYVTGTLGDAYAGFELLRWGREGTESLLTAYNRPVPLLSQGQALAPHVSAMMDVSDGLLLDAQRMAAASNLALEIDVGRVPLSPDYTAVHGSGRDARLQAASWGDDYQLLFAASEDALSDEFLAAALPGSKATRIGSFREGCGLNLYDDDGPIPLPEKTGYQHG